MKIKTACGHDSCCGFVLFLSPVFRLRHSSSLLSDYNLSLCAALLCVRLSVCVHVCACVGGGGGGFKYEKLKDAEMKRFGAKETSSICTGVSACSNYSRFEAESSKTVLLAHPESWGRC